MKKVILLLIIIMAASLVGLVVIQAFWIRNSIRLKEEVFQQLVNTSLNNVAATLEAQEAAKQLNNEVSLFNNALNNPMMLELFKSQGFSDTMSGSVTFSEDFFFRTGDSSSFGSDISIFSNDSLVYNSTSQAKGIMSLQSYPSGMQNQMQLKASFVEEILGKLMFANRDIKDKIDPNLLEPIIRSSLENTGIVLDFEYSVYDAYGQSVYASGDYQADHKAQKFECLLFPSDYFSPPSYLSIYFPHKQDFFEPLGFVVGSSVILLLVILLIFSSTIFIILRQRKLSEMKAAFVNNMTHELKTPISTLSLASQMLKDQSIPFEKKNMPYISKVIDDESRRLGYQVEKVLQMAIFDKGKISLKLKAVNIHDLLEQTINSFALKLEQKSGKVNRILDAPEHVVEADEVHITNVIVNLIDNAIKYSREPAEITLATRKGKSGIEISVKDKGIGIPKEYQKRIYDQFFRVPTGNLHDVKGFGLGLSYVKKIVEEHSGSVKFKSEVNRGTEFIVSLPYRQQKQLKRPSLWNLKSVSF